MYLINISLKADNIPTEQAEQMFAEHRAWFAKYFQAGNFLLLGPYSDHSHAGVIIAQTADRAELNRILAEDVYFNLDHVADYEIREFTAAMASANLADFQGK